MRVQQNLISGHNSITEGLNFLVPLFWWNNFLARNLHICSMRDMRLEGGSPLDYLYQLRIIDEDRQLLGSSLKAIVQVAQFSLEFLQMKLSEAAGPDTAGQGKRSRVGCDWLHDATKLGQHDCHLFLHSPTLNQDMLQLYQMEEQTWVLISPELYRLISLKYAQNTRQPTHSLVAIPTFTSKYEAGTSFKFITFHQRHRLDLFFRDFAGYTFAFNGYIDPTVTLHQLVKYLKDGVYRLLTGSKPDKSSEQCDMLLYFDSFSQIFYDFVSQAVSQQLGWVHFNEIKAKVLQSSHVHQISIFAITHGSGETQGKKQIYERLDATAKRIKPDFPLYSDTPHTNPPLRTSSQPLPAYRPLPPYTLDPNPTHPLSSHQSPLLQEKAPRNLVPLAPGKYFERICYPIWKRPQTQKMTKLAEQNITFVKIVLPYQDRPFIALNDNGNTITLPKLTNELIKDELGQLTQQQATHPLTTAINPAQDLPHSLDQQLQIFAQQIAQQVQQTKQSTQPLCEAQVQEENRKDQSSNNGRTGINQLTNKLDYQGRDH